MYDKLISVDRGYEIVYIPESKFKLPEHPNGYIPDYYNCCKNGDRWFDYDKSTRTFTEIINHCKVIQGDWLVVPESEMGLEETLYKMGFKSDTDGADVFTFKYPCSDKPADYSYRIRSRGLFIRRKNSDKVMYVGGFTIV